MNSDKLEFKLKALVTVCRLAESKEAEGMYIIECAQDIIKSFQPKPTCDVCGSENLTEAPHMGLNCNDCHPI